MAKPRAGRGKREEKGAVLEERGGTESLSPDNEACLAWLEDAQRWLRAEGQTRVAGYLEAVSEEVLFEMKGDRSVVNYGVAHSTEGAQALEEDACSGCW